MTNGQKFIDIFGVACGTYDEKSNTTTIQLKGDWWDREFEGETDIDYQKYIGALRQCAREHEGDRTSLGHIIVSDLCRDTADLLAQIKEEREG